MFKQDISNQGKGLIYDADLADLLGYDRQADIHLEASLKEIHRFCEQNYFPHLNIVVIKREICLAGRAEMLSNLGWLLREQNRVRKFDWFDVQMPTTENFKEHSGKKTSPKIARLEAAVGGLRAHKDISY